MLDVPLPVEVPDDKVRPPPFLFVAPLVAPLACTVKPFPAVFAVGLRSIQKVCAAEPLSDRSLVGDVVPMPTLPAFVNTNFVLEAFKAVIKLPPAPASVQLFDKYSVL